MDLDPDPWSWSVADVQRFFRVRAAEFVADMPYARLPLLGHFLERLHDDDVDGAVLLTAVDSAWLKEDAGLSSLGTRATVIRCIEKLRRQSITYSLQDKETSLNLSLPLRAPAPVPVLQESRDEPQGNELSPQAVGEHVRAGETAVEDDHGRKRRKLNPTKIELTPMSTIRPGYLGISAMSVKHLFWGSYAIGEEIGEMPPPGDVLIHRDDQARDIQEHNFQFQSHDWPVGTKEFVQSHLRHFLGRARQDLQVERNGRNALALLPYREGQQASIRSATVIQFGANGDEPVAILERALSLEHGPRQEDSSLHSGGEWEFLIEKYQDSNDKLLPEWGQSGTEDFDIASSENSNSESGAEEVDEDHDFLANEQATQVIQNCVAEFTAAWHAKLPALEEKRAWSTWKKMKQSRTLRAELTMGANARIKYFTDRLDRFVAKLLADSWTTEGSLVEAAQILEVTVEERETERWKIEVWKRRQEPTRIVRAHSSKGGVTTSPSRSNLREARLVIPAADRFSVSPTSMGDLGDEHVEDITYQADDEDHGNEDAPSHDQAACSDDSTVLSQDLEDVTMADDKFIARNEDGGTLDTDHTLDKEPYGGDGFAFGNEPKETDQQRLHRATSADSEDDLPDMSQLITSSRKRSSQPQTPINHTSDLIDLTLTSSDTETPQTGRSETGDKRQTGLEGDPLQQTVADVESWQLATLAKRPDRLRILIKLLHEAGPEVRNDLSDLMKTLKKPGFVEQLQSELARLRRGEVETLNSESCTMLYTVNFFWYWLSPSTPQPPPLQEDQWNEVVYGSQQPRLFADMLFSALTQKATKLFVTKKVDHKARLSAISNVRTSSEEAPHKRRTTRKQQKRSVVPRDRRGQEMRDQASARQRRLAESQSHLQELSLRMDPSTSTVEINPVATSEGKSAICIADSIATKMKPHQIDGVRFMWEEITANSGQGCVLAHVMGLGKTMQAITLLVALFEATQSEDPGVQEQIPKQFHAEKIQGKRRLRALVLCPPMLIPNWARECDRWAGKKLGNIFCVDSTNKLLHLDLLESWEAQGGVLLIGYHVFRLMLSPLDASGKPKSDRSVEDYEKLERLLLRGPEIVVADEAHNLKNLDAATTKAAGRIRTQSRIALTGTPMGNDVTEIYSLVCWVSPGFLGNPREFEQHFAKPIREGLYSDSSHSEKRKSLMRLRVLHAEIQPKVNRASIEVLRGSLKTKIEFVITVPLTDLQHRLYNRYIDAVSSGDKSKVNNQVTIFAWLTVLSLLTNHPECFRRKLMAPPKEQSKGKKGRPRKTQDHDETPEANSGTSTPIDGAEAATIEELSQREGGETALMDKSVGFDDKAVQELLAGFQGDADPLLSTKVDIFLRLLEYCKEISDKALVFSTSIPTLEYLDELLKSKGVRFGRIDGSTPMSDRDEIVKAFYTDFDVMLVSTRAGGVGLNIHEANRVFIFDFGFNPSVEEQAIGRAYRLGQEKPVFVYRFLAGGTFENNIYNKQLFKTTLTQRVVDKKNTRRTAERDAREYLFQPYHVEQKDLYQWLGKDPDVLDRLIQTHGPGEPGKRDTCIRSILTMETLQEDAMDAPLDELEMQEVNKEIETNRLRPRQRPMRTVASSPATPSTTTAAAASRFFGTSPRRPNFTPSMPQPSSTAQPPFDLGPTDVRNRISLPQGHPMGGLPMPRGTQ